MMKGYRSKDAISQEDFTFAQGVIGKLGDYFTGRVVGQENLKKSLITAIVADGHILIESVPGLAKTTAAKAISDAVGGKFSRIQCTPDLLPSDIIGTQIYHQETGKFETIFGPVFANFVLLDEVNRSSAKTQSAMLEAMQERQVTIGGKTYRMPQDIFIVIATQNPIEQEGTYPLSEAQTDRFMIKETITYPSAEEEITIMNKIEDGSIAKKLPAVLTLEDVDRVQNISDQVYVDDAVKKYIADIVILMKTIFKYAVSDGNLIEICLSLKQENGYVVMTISDDGPGMEEEILQRIRDSKPIEKDDGTHIGIYNSLYRLKKLCGEDCILDVQSVLTEGTTVRIMLPLHPDGNITDGNSEKKGAEDGEGHNSDR